MRILILANHAVGLHNFRLELIEELILKGHTVYFTVPEDKDNEQVVNISKSGAVYIQTMMERRCINPYKDMKLICLYNKIIKDIRPEYIITYTIKPNIYGGLVSTVNKIPYAANITGLGTAFQKNGLLKGITIFLYKLALKKAQVVFFENSENKNIFINHKIIKENRACVLNGAGVNISKYVYTDYPEDGHLNFLFIGRIMKEKGIDELLYAAEKIKQENHHISFHIVGPIEDNYISILKDYHEKGILIYYGFQSDVKPFIEKTHCFILPSYHEGMANTLLECASMGRPLITSNIHGCMEAVQENGFLCQVKSKEDLYFKIVDFIKLPYEKKVMMSKKSREHIENNFSKTDVIKKTIESLFI